MRLAIFYIRLKVSDALLELGAWIQPEFRYRRRHLLDEHDSEFIEYRRLPL